MALTFDLTAKERKSKAVRIDGNGSGSYEKTKDKIDRLLEIDDSELTGFEKWKAKKNGTE